MRALGRPNGLNPTVQSPFVSSCLSRPVFLVLAWATASQHVAVCPTVNISPWRFAAPARRFVVSRSSTSPWAVSQVSPHPSFSSQGHLVACKLGRSHLEGRFALHSALSRSCRLASFWIAVREFTKVRRVSVIVQAVSRDVTL